MTDRSLRSYVVLSILAGAMLLMLIWLVPGKGSSLTTLDRTIVGVAFAAACAFGLVRSLRPGGLRMHGYATSRSSKEERPSRARIGHHPDCEHFSDHTVEVDGKKRCAGCLGLAIGSLLGIAAVPFYVLLSGPPSDLAALALVIGYLLIVGAFLENSMRNRSAAPHVLANVALVLGFAAVVFGSTEASSSLFVGLFAVLFCFLWMDTRIKMSETRHAETCRECPEDCKAY